LPQKQALQAGCARQAHLPTGGEPRAFDAAAIPAETRRHEALSPQPSRAASQSLALLLLVDPWPMVAGYACADRVSVSHLRIIHS
jgi:hypothetical protein